MRTKKLAVIATMAVTMLGIGTAAQALVDLDADADAEIELEVELLDELDLDGGPVGPIVGGVLFGAFGVVDFVGDVAAECLIPPVDVIDVFNSGTDITDCLDALNVNVLGDDVIADPIFGSGPFSILGSSLGGLNVIDFGLGWLLNELDGPGNLLGYL